ncbi:MAG: hypothetical protein OXC19_22930 [Bryobacterales bacterium]|nr:hypothetical protein [Bryobacterales bacterium]
MTLADIRNEFAARFKPEFVQNSMAERVGEEGTFIDYVHQRSAVRPGGSSRAQ